MNKQYTDILMQILTICSEKKLSFTYQNGVKKNYMEIREGEVIVNIFDTDDPNLLTYLDKKIKELNAITPC